MPEEFPPEEEPFPDDEPYEEDCEKAPEICLLLHTEHLRILLDWRTLDVWSVHENNEMSIDDCIELVDELGKELRIYREHGVQTASSLRKPRKREDNEDS